MCNINGTNPTLPSPAAAEGWFHHLLWTLSIKPSPTQKLAISLSMSLLCFCLKALVPALTLSC